MDLITSAIEKCPFLNELAIKHGTEFARHIATQPTKTAGTVPRRPLLEEVDSFHTTFNLFHGKSGVVPLQKPQTDSNQTKDIQDISTSSDLDRKSPGATRQCRPPMFASMTLSMGAMPDPGKGREFNKNKLDRNKNQSSRRNLQRNQRFKPISASSGAAGTTPGGCPLRQFLGPMTPVVFNAKGNLQCPEIIVKMRAALSRTGPVRNLRPQALPVKLLAVGATSAAVNIPCGAIREHFDKFSLGWFLAVHASIPFVAMLRKAVVMPKFAIAMTVAAAIAGQVFGSRLERYRLAQLSASHELAEPAAQSQNAAVRPEKRAEALHTASLNQASPKSCPLRDILFVKESCGSEDMVPHQQASMFAHLSSPIRVA